MRASGLLLSLAAALLLGASPADAARVAIGVVGTAGDNGQVDVILEDNDGPNRKPDLRRAIHMVDIRINQGNTASESATAVRDTLDLELPPEYNVFVYQGTTVVIDRPGEILNFEVFDNVPGQNFFETEPPTGRSAPIGPAALAISGAGMLVAGGLAVRRRRRIATPS